jgi:nucleoid DNA-binding protein
MKKRRNKKMTKKELVKEISTNTGFTQKDVMAVVDSAIDVITKTVSSDEISITGFGKFFTTQRSERIMRNPSTGEQVTVPAKKSLKFRPAKAFKDSVNS